MKTNKVLSGSRLERKKEETKKKIISVALKLMANQGVESTTMEEIAAQVDIAKGTLYNYFPVKEAIIDEYIRRTFEERNAERILRLRKLRDTRARMISILTELMDGIQSQRDIFETYFIYRIQQMISLRVDESSQSGLFQLEQEIIQLGQQEKEVREDLPPEMLSGLFEFVFIKLAQQYYQNPDSFKPRQTIEQGVELFLKGVGS